MDSQSQFTDIVELIYTAGLCADEWPNALTRIADATGGRMVALRSYDPVTRASLGFFPRNDPEYIASYHAYWAERNSNFQRLAQEPVGAIWHGLQYMTRAEFMRTDYFNEWCGPQELDQTIGSNLARYGATTAFANISRPYRLGPFEPEGVALFTACIPHLRRAMQMNVKLGALAQGERALQRSFDRIGREAVVGSLLSLGSAACRLRDRLARG